MNFKSALTLGCFEKGGEATDSGAKPAKPCLQQYLNPANYIEDDVLFIALHVVGPRFSLSRPADRTSLGLAQAFRASHLIQVNIMGILAQPGVSYTHISGVLLSLSLLKFSTPTLNSSMGFLKVLLTHLQ